MWGTVLYLTEKVDPPPIYMFSFHFSCFHQPASQDALSDLRPGHQFRSPYRRRSRRRDRPSWVRHPHERRPHHQGLRPRCRPPHLPARHSSLQHAEGPTQSARAAQFQPGHSVHLLGPQQLHETWREGLGVQQPETDEPGAAKTQSLHHLLAEDAAVRWALQEGDGEGQVSDWEGVTNGMNVEASTLWSTSLPHYFVLYHWLNLYFDNKIYDS